MTEGTSIETQRLTLRTVTMDDMDEVARTWDLDGAPISRDGAEAQIERMMKNHRTNAQGTFVHLCLAIVHKDDGQFIGWCGLDHTDRAKANPVLFYLLLRQYWGRGLATEAARAVLRHGFCELRIPEIVAGASAENLASKRVLEKIGMRYLGEDSNGGFSFALTAAEFSAQTVGS